MTLARAAEEWAVSSLGFNITVLPAASEEMDGISFQIDLSSFPKGIYFITIRSKDFVTTEKVIKM